MERIRLLFRVLVYSTASPMLPISAHWPCSHYTSGLYVKGKLRPYVNCLIGKSKPCSSGACHKSWLSPPFFNLWIRWPDFARVDQMRRSRTRFALLRQP